MINLRTRKVSSMVIFIFCLSASIAFIVSIISNGVKSIDDLSELDGQVDYISQHKVKNATHYDLRLIGYSNLFKIGADYESIFDFNHFSKSVYKYDTIRIVIKTKHLANLNSDKLIKIKGLEHKKKIYLDKNETFKYDREARRIIAPVGGTILILLSFFVYYYRRNVYHHDF